MSAACFSPSFFAQLLPDAPGAAGAQVRLEPLSAALLDAVMAVERRAYPHPWSRGNFVDALQTGFLAQCLMAGDALLGYFVAMKGVGEVHLLNITVAPQCQRQGWAPLLLDALSLWSRAQGAQWLWLEVRVSNTRAQQVYRRYGFQQVAVRRAYYPAGNGQREDAAIMNFQL